MPVLNIRQLKSKIESEHNSSRASNLKLKKMKSQTDAELMT